MILAILGMLLKVLPGSILGFVERRATSQNETLRIHANEEIERRKIQASVLVKEADHWIAWLPRFTLAMTVAIYYGGVFVISVFQLPWVILQVPGEVETVGQIVVGGLFLERVSGIIKR